MYRHYYQANRVYRIYHFDFMQQFLVPQFIDVEDKIIGPVTTRQFVIMLAAILLTFMWYELLAFIYFIFACSLTLAIASVLAFAKINGRPIHFFLLNFIQTSKRANLRVWSKAAYVRDVQVVKSELKEAKTAAVKREPVSGSRLADLTLVINTGGVFRGGSDDVEDLPI